MLKYEKIIRHLKLEEKVNLLTTDKVLGNTMIENYDLPLFCIIRRVDNFDIPSNSALASTWNRDLIRSASKEVSAHIVKDELIGLKPYLSCNVKDDYFEGKVLGSIISGIEEGKTSSCLLDVPVNNYTESYYRDQIFLPYEIALKEGKPTLFNTKSLDKASYIMNELNYEGFSIVELDSEFEVIKAINENQNLVYTTEEAGKIIINAVKEYERLQRLLQGNQIEKSEIDIKICKNEIISPEQLDKVVDRYLDGLAHIDANRLYRYRPNKAVFKDVCDESIVLLKNDSILPLDFTAKPAIIGQLAKEPIVYNSFDDLYDDAVAAVDCVDFEISGYDYGYFEDEDNKNLLDAAVELGKSSDCAIVYLGVREGNKLPKNQMDLITKLYDNGIHIIAVITSSEPLIMDFDYMCSAILYSKLASSDILKSSIEIIGGKKNPTGKTIEYFPINSQVINPEDPTTYLYPFGHGLSYTVIDYSDLRVDQEGLELTLVNNGAYNTKEVVQLYVEYVDDTGLVHERKLRGFKKVPLKSKEALRVNIEFDEYTFRSYFEEEKSYGIKGGKYNILIGRSINEIELISTLELEDVIFNNDDKSELVLNSSNQEVINEFINQDDEYIKYRPKKLSIKARLAISIPLIVYITAMIIILVLMTGFDDENLLLSIILLVFLVISYVLFFIHIGLLVKDKNKIKEQKLTEQDVTLHVDMLPQFNQLSSFTYPTPKPEVIDEEELDYTITEAEETVEEIVAPEAPQETPQEAPTVKPVTQIEVIENIDFELYVKGFIDYALAYGLIIEPKSARFLLSALASSQMVFVRSGSSELLPKLAEIVSGYFNSPYSTYSLSKASTPFETMWELNEANSYVPTTFANQLRYAIENENGIIIQTLTDVNPTEIIPVLGNIFKFISNPNDKYYLNSEATGNEENNVIPKNIKFIVLENDTKYLEALPREVASATLSVDVNLRPNQIIDENAEIEVKYFTNKLLIHTINRLKENNFIPEESWKKIDDFEEAFNNYEYFAIHNKEMLIYEKFAGALIEAGSELDEVIDFVFAAGIIPCLKSTKTYQGNKGDQTIFTILEKIFGADYLQLTEKTNRKAN